MEIKLTGVTFDNRQQNIKAVYLGEKVFLVRKKLNPYDSNAI